MELYSRFSILVLLVHAGSCKKEKFSKKMNPIWVNQEPTANNCQNDSSKNQLKQTSQYISNRAINDKIALVKGDITTLEVDAIVNAAKTELTGGGGVDSAIHLAAGPGLLAECRRLGGCETGDSKITRGYNLPANYVIHTVGPIGENPTLLQSCYKRSLDLMDKHKLKTIAFPCISTGIYGYPNEAAAHIALKTVRQWLDTHPYAKQLDKIIFCLFQKKDFIIYNKLLPIYFPGITTSC